MAFNSTRLIAPPQEEDIYPYRPVWASLLIEISVLSFVAVVFFVLSTFLNIRPSGTIQAIGIVFLALMPAILWLIFSFLAEQRVQQPRRKLLVVFVMTLLVANAIGIPLVENFLTPNDWLAQSSAVNRILGYAVTYGATQEILKYLVVRYIVWKNDYRIRSDSVAYCVTSAIAYALVMNLHFISQNPQAGLDVVSARVLLHVAVNIAGSLVVSYGLSESALANAPIVLLPFTFLVAAMVSGGSIAMRTNVHNAGLGLTEAITRPLFSLAFILFVAYASFFVMLFLYRVAQKRDEDIKLGQ